MKSEKNRRVLLVYPPSSPCLREGRCQVPAGNSLMSPALPPTDLLYLAAVGEQAGWQCRVEDYGRRAGTVENALAEIRSYDPRYLVITVTTPTIAADLDFCAALKRDSPGAQIIAKGAHALLFDRNMLEQCPELDMVLRGEPETTFQDIISERDRASIPGLTWRDSGAVRRNPDRPYNERLDTLPFPARHLIDNRRYERPDTGMPQAVIQVSRGCPYHCFYCLATPLSGKRVRLRSPENILAEVRECVETYGIRDFLFWSDVFNADREWVLSLCDGIRRSGMNIRWAANSRADGVDRETAAAMRDSGCNLVSIGVESGSQEMLDRIGKNLRLDDIRKAFSILKETGIPTIAYYQLGLPWETVQSIEDTVRFSLELDSDYANYYVSTPFPGTRFYEYAREHGLFETGNDPTLFGNAYVGPSVRGHHLERAEIGKLRYRAVLRYLCRPSYIVGKIGRVRSWRQLVAYAVAAISIVRPSGYGRPTGPVRHAKTARTAFS